MVLKPELSSSERPMTIDGPDSFYCNHAEVSKALADSYGGAIVKISGSWGFVLILARIENKFKLFQWIHPGDKGHVCLREVDDSKFGLDICDEIEAHILFRNFVSSIKPTTMLKLFPTLLYGNS